MTLSGVVVAGLRSKIPALVLMLTEMLPVSFMVFFLGQTWKQRQCFPFMMPPSLNILFLYPLMYWQMCMLQSFFLGLSFMSVSRTRMNLIEGYLTWPSWSFSLRPLGRSMLKEAGNPEFLTSNSKRYQGLGRLSSSTWKVSSRKLPLGPFRNQYLGEMQNLLKTSLTQGYEAMNSLSM